MHLEASLCLKNSLSLSLLVVILLYAELGRWRRFFVNCSLCNATKVHLINYFTVMTESIRNLSVGLGLESSLIVTKLLPVSMQPRTEINGQNIVFVNSTCTWTMRIMKNIYVKNSNHGSNSKLFKFGKKSLGALAPPNGGECREIWEGRELSCCKRLLLLPTSKFKINNLTTYVIFASRIVQFVFTPYQ